MAEEKLKLKVKKGKIKIKQGNVKLKITTPKVKICKFPGCQNDASTTLTPFCAEHEKETLKKGKKLAKKAAGTAIAVVGMVFGDRDKDK